MVTARQTGVFFCKYPCEHEAVFAREIRNRLTEETGVDLSPDVNSFLLDSDFPYHKFLKNSNKEIRKYFRERFSNF